MKKQISKALALHRETVAVLQGESLERAVGGAPTKPLTCAATCGATCEGCPPPP